MSRFSLVKNLNTISEKPSVLAYNLKMLHQYSTIDNNNCKYKNLK